MKKSFERIELTEEHHRIINFRVSADRKLGEIFSKIENIRDEHRSLIEDYTVTQVTLDDVFVNFAKQTFLEENSADDSSC